MTKGKRWRGKDRYTGKREEREKTEYEEERKVDRLKIGEWERGRTVDKVKEKKRGRREGGEERGEERGRGGERKNSR